MQDEREAYVLVPNADRTAMLANEGRLPCVSSSLGVAGAIAVLRSAYSLAVPYLRPARILWGEESGKGGAALYEFDAPCGDWAPPTTLSWLPLGEADPARLVPPSLAPYAEKWLAIAGGAPIPERRPPWARPGWLAEASTWIEESSTECGLRQTMPLEVVKQWPLSSVLRCETDGGCVYFKAVFSLFRHEPALTWELAKNHPSVVSEMLAVDETRGWMLMRELSGSLLGDQSAHTWAGALRAAAEVQRAWAARTEELFELGAHDRRLAMLGAEIGSAFEAAEISAVGRAIAELGRRCEELNEGLLPHTLVHGDLHPWNVMVDGDELRIFDWSDACVSHPLFDLPTFLQPAGDEAAREAVLNTYLGAWADLAVARRASRGLSACAAACPCPPRDQLSADH